MPELNSRTWVVAAWAGIAVLAASVPVLLVLGRGIGALVVLPFLAVSIAFVLFVPRLPTLFDALFAWSAVLNAAGYAWDFYPLVPLYDEIVHMCTIFAITLTFGYLTYHAVRPAFRDHPGHFLVMIASFGIATGALWEVFEWTFGFIGPIFDTVMDLIVDSIGAFAAALLAAHARNFEPPGEERGG